MNKLFDILPYDALARFKLAHLMLAGLVLGGAVFGGFWFTLHASAEEEVAALEKKKADFEATLQRYQAEIVQHPFLLRKVAALQGDLEEQKRQLPSERELPELLNRVANVSDILGLEINEFNLGSDISKKAFYRNVPMTVTMIGTYYSTLGFFDWLQNLLHVVDIENLEMRESSESRRNFEALPGSPPVTEHLIRTTIEAKIYAYVDETS